MKAWEKYGRETAKRLHPKTEFTDRPPAPPLFKNPVNLPVVMPDPAEEEEGEESTDPNEGKEEPTDDAPVLETSQELPVDDSALPAEMRRRQPAPYAHSNPLLENLPPPSQMDLPRESTQQRREKQ